MFKKTFLDFVQLLWKYAKYQSRENKLSTYLLYENILAPTTSFSCEFCIMFNSYFVLIRFIIPLVRCEIALCYTVKKKDKQIAKYPTKFMAFQSDKYKFILQSIVI